MGLDGGTDQAPNVEDGLPDFMANQVQIADDGDAFRHVMQFTGESSSLNMSQESARPINIASRGSGISSEEEYAQDAHLHFRSTLPSMMG